MFGFPKISRPTSGEFKHNFLRSVTLQIKFPSNSELGNKQNLIQEKFKQTLPRFSQKKGHGVEIKFSKEQTPFIQPLVSNNSSLELKSNDGNRVLTILNDTIIFNISGEAYKSFLGIISEIKILKECLVSCGIEELDTISIRKVNLIDFKKIEENDDTPFDILSNILKSSLLNDISYFPSTNMIKQQMQNVNYASESYILNLIYGIIVQNERLGQIALDIDLIKKVKSQTLDLENEFSKINDEIFNVFNWAISDNGLSILKD